MHYALKMIDACYNMQDVRVIGTWCKVCCMPSVLWYDRCSCWHAFNIAVCSNAAAGSALVAVAVCAALYLIIWRHRRRKLRSLDSKSSPRDPGSPHGGLPIALRPPYKQGSADSQEPFLDGRRRTAALVPWRKSKAGQDLRNAPQLVSQERAAFAMIQAPRTHSVKIAINQCSGAGLETRPAPFFSPPKSHAKPQV